MVLGGDSEIRNTGVPVLFGIIATQKIKSGVPMNSDVEVVSDFKIERHDWHDPLVEACCNFVKFKDDLDLSNRTSCVHPFLVRKLRWLLGYYEPSEKMIKHRRPRRKATATYPSHFIQNRILTGQWRLFAQDTTYGGYISCCNHYI